MRFRGLKRSPEIERVHQRGALQICRMPYRRSRIGACTLRPSLYVFAATPRPAAGFLPQSGSTPLRKEPLRQTRTFRLRTAGTRHVVTQYWGAATKAAMSRKLVWIEQQRFRGFGCSECGWRFTPSGAPTGTSFDEMMRNFEAQRDKAFTLHVCADYPKSQDHKL